MADKEIEIQVKVGDVSPLLAFLEKEGEFKFSDRQIDEYYTPVHKNFSEVDPVKQWLRLRDSNGKYSINYKNWHYGQDGKSNYCDEFESKIENLEQLKKILTALDFKLLTVVDKERRSWQYKDYEISVDKLANIGDFVEIEYKGEGAGDEKEITANMVKFLNDLGVA